MYLPTLNILYVDLGISILEMSHRSKEFDAIMADFESNIRNFMEVPKNFKILYMQGGSTLQFSAVPLNLLGKHKVANYLVTGHWSEKAADEAKKYCTVHHVIDPKVVKDGKFKTIQDSKNWTFDKDAAYTYYCDNETIAGLEMQHAPFSPNHYLVADCSSNFASRKIDWTNHGLVYACGQKNYGPVGITIVIIRDDLLA